MMAGWRDGVKTHKAIWTTRMFVKTKWINEILITFISRRGCNLHSWFIATCPRSVEGQDNNHFVGSRLQR